MTKVMLGIFWIVPDTADVEHLLMATCPPAAAEAYDDFLKYPDGHLDTWSTW